MGGETVIRTSFRPETPKPEKQPRKKRRKLTFSERLLRNTAVACALLLAILTVKNLDAPWAGAAMDGIESALTMRLDPDMPLEKMSLVQKWVPESTLVFLGISGKGAATPVSGEEEHPFYAGQPWTIFACPESAGVRAALSGTVSAVGQMESGDWYVLMDHGDGLESLYAYLEKPPVAAGDGLERGAELGRVRGMRLYYEMRKDGQSIDPSQVQGS